MTLSELEKSSGLSLHWLSDNEEIFVFSVDNEVTFALSLLPSIDLNEEPEASCSGWRNLFVFPCSFLLTCWRSVPTSPSLFDRNRVRLTTCASSDRSDLSLSACVSRGSLSPESRQFFANTSDEASGSQFPSGWPNVVACCALWSFDSPITREDGTCGCISGWFSGNSCGSLWTKWVVISVSLFTYSSKLPPMEHLRKFGNSYLESPD